MSKSVYLMVNSDGLGTLYCVWQAGNEWWWGRYGSHEVLRIHSDLIWEEDDAAYQVAKERNREYRGSVDRE